MQQTVEAIRDWFRECPAIKKGYRFGIDTLAADPTEYAIYLSPSNLAAGVDIFGEVFVKTEQEQIFMFASREKHPRDVLQALANHGFYEEVISWMISQNKLKKFPAIEAGTVISIVPTLTQYLFEAGANSGRYQISCKMKYRRNV